MYDMTRDGRVEGRHIRPVMPVLKAIRSACIIQIWNKLFTILNVMTFSNDMSPALNFSTRIL